MKNVSAPSSHAPRGGDSWERVCRTLRVLLSEFCHLKILYEWRGRTARYAWRMSCCFDVLISFTPFAESPYCGPEGTAKYGGLTLAMVLVPDWHTTGASQSEAFPSIFYMDARRDAHFAGVATPAGYETGHGPDIS